MTTTLNASTAGAGGFIATSDNSGALALQTAGTTAVTINSSQSVSFVNAPKIGTNSLSMVLLGSATASNSASIDFTGLPANTYNSYRLYVDCAVPVTNAVNLLLRVSSGGTFQTSSYTWQNFRWTTSGSGVIGQTNAGTGIALDAAGADNISNSANNGGSWVIDWYVPSQTTDLHRCNYQGFYLGSAHLGIVGNGYSGINTIDGFRFLMDSGNISTGRFSLYGIRNS